MLSNNHVNEMISHNSRYSGLQQDEEVLAYYISFLKTISMKLNERKRQSYAALARAAAAKRVCAREEYESLMGKLTFAATCYPMGRQWLHAPWRAARAAFRTSGGGVVVSRAVREELLRWAAELEDDQEGTQHAEREETHEELERRLMREIADMPDQMALEEAARG